LSTTATPPHQKAIAPGNVSHAEAPSLACHEASGPIRAGLAISKHFHGQKSREASSAREDEVRGPFDVLLRSSPKPGKPPLPAATVQRVVDLALGPPPGEASHWTGRMLAKAAGVSLRSVQRILEAHQLAPHRIRTFKLSNDPKFAEKLKDIVGLYVDPPAHAVVLSVDEKSEIQALDRTQPGLPMKAGRAGTMTHDYKRHGTTTLFAALNVLDGTVIGHNMKHDRHQEFIRFLNAIETQVPKRNAIHAIVDNYATHKHAKVRARHPRWTCGWTDYIGIWLSPIPPV
jgi:hypothetical protein